MINREKSDTNKKWALLIIAFYVIGRMVAEPFFWNKFSIYYSYLYEVIIVIFSYFQFKTTALWKKITKKFFGYWLAVFVIGFIAHSATKKLNLNVPFDLSSGETIFLLLAVAPVLEEAIFRMALWDAFNQFTKNKYFLIFISTFLFMAGHLSAYWFVPAEYRGFVLYQSAYVVVLGIIASVARFKSNSINAPILLHFAFNFGFFVSARL